MRCKLITLFLFLCVTVSYAAKRIYENGTPAARTTFRKNQSAAATFVPLNPRQIRRAEITIKRFLTRLTGRSIAKPITLRSSSSDGGSLRETIRQICETIRAKIMEFARAIGLVTSVRRYRQAPRNLALSEDWFSEGLIQGSLLLCDLVEVKEEAWRAIVRYFGTRNVTLRENEELSPRRATRSFKFLSVINDAARFNEGLFKCLLSIGHRGERASSFDLSRALGNLAKGSPNDTVKAFRSRLDRAFLHHASSNDTSSKRLYVLLCHSLVERISHYDDCMVVLRRLETCALSPRHDPSKLTVNRALRIKPWLAAVEGLSDCKIYIDAQDSSASVRCDLDRRIPRTTAQRLKYIYGKILGRRISRRSSLYRVANELGDALSRSGWGRQFTYDVCRYFAIYQEGRRQLNTLARNAAKDKKAAARHKEMAKSLSLYKDGILKKTMVAIGNFHRSALETQRFLTRAIENPFQKLWLTRITTLRLIFDFMMGLYDLYEAIKSHDADVDMPIPIDIPTFSTTDSSSVMLNDDLNDGNNRIQHFVVHQMTKDEAFEGLLRTMNRVSEMRNSNRSTLACLANNLLLVAMFMETVGFVSTMFCLGERKNESDSEELKDEWVTPGRDRRSLFSKDFTETEAITKDPSMITEVPQDLANIYNEADINSTTQTAFIEVTNDLYDLINSIPRNMNYNERFMRSTLFK